MSVTTSGTLRLSQPAGRWVMVATALGAGLVLLETTVVNVALPAIGSDLGASLTGLQWSVNAFTLTLSGFILLGGALGDRFGRRRIYLVGMAWFAVASLLCGLADDVGWLIAARALQGIGGALLVPGSLALIQESFHPDDRARAVGAWSGLSGVAGAAGPLVGGWLVDVANWRWAFFVNIPVAVVVSVLLVRHVPESRDAGPPRRFDLAGGLLAAVGLGGVTYALTEAATAGWPVVAAAIVGVVAISVFLQVERRSREPMLPLGLFSSRDFSAANLASFFFYGAVAGLFFLLPIQLQVAVGYSPLGAGLALLPATVLVLVLSARAGALTARTGARLLLSAGSLVCVAALLLALRIAPGAWYLTDVLPTVALIGIGISLITPAISTTVLGAVPEERTGIASAVNNGVARTAGLVAVAALPVIAGLPQDATEDPAALNDGFVISMLVCAGLFLAGGVTTWFGVRRHDKARPPRVG
ncbi:MFS transporter [Actinophytocola algeriensis]|uniref:EmrB/QacA subfamily drug resistance transporter n=1 Tax=Actinophytocola algeriensis TaxID=1768010 RepID=A0A7W7VFL5_9PSEU|nr:MFS transporter [Actinophytocola algeriensis]MBB4908431.1 EmrB/QacA subfamily drug resistance transporter [Actinophytocola algeriensis]MBE1475182.1 EmrB/QacA subfamily drug resistance transporter [Actinophytocola algeriensis]